MALDNDGAAQYLQHEAMKIFVRHVIAQQFISPMRGKIREMRLRPRQNACQHVLSWSIAAGEDCAISEEEDFFGNLVQTIEAGGRAPNLTATVRGEIETFDTAGVLSGEMERVAPDFFLRETETTAPDSALRDFSREAVKGAKTGLDRPHFLMRAIHETIAFAPSAAPPEAAAAVFAAKTGASGDMAHVFVAAARALDIPARFVSGYLASDSEGAAYAADASDLRGWAEAYVAGLGWIGFDPSICLCMHEGHVRLAVALDYSGAAPLRIAPAPGAAVSIEVSARFVGR
ncbi:MAG: transglutaminase domain-containing protein [Rhodoblastus sp.]